MKNINMEQEVSKEIELNVEKEKLKETVELINQEVLKLIDYRKKFSEYIVQYRKNVLEEYRDDEDKIIEYFDHEKYLKEQTYNSVDKKLKELTELKSTPYFGRVDFSEEDYGIDRLYIGKFGLSPEGYDEPVVVDWRAPVASLFYEGKVGEAAYKAPVGEIKVDILKRRQFMVNNGQLNGMFDSELNIRDEILQKVLSDNAGEKLKDIVMTIQKEQDEIIREPRYTTVVVDGAAGSGKTTIALHRVAYLLYNYRNVLEDKVLILGPNRIFMEYISDVLPALGETGVNQSTFTELAEYLLDIEDITPYREYMERLMNNDEEFIEDMIYKTSEDYIGELDKLIDELENYYFEIEAIKFRNKIVMEKSEINDLFKVHFKHMPLFKRSKKIKRVIFSKLKDYRDELIREIEKRYKESIDSLTEEQLEIEENDLQFKRRLEIREVIKDLMKIKSELNWLDNPNCVEIYNEFNNNNRLTMDDLAPILYLKIKLEGFKLEQEIKHVVIDEAQDFSKLQFLVVKELTKTPALTILGDSNQRLMPIKGNVPISNIEEIYEDLKIKKYYLNKSYRSTKEIMDFANNYLTDGRVVPLVRNGEPVEHKRIKLMSNIKEVIVDKLRRFKEKGYESIAVITKDFDISQKVYNDIKEEVNIKIIDNEDVIYHSGVVVVPSYFAKGLEFDGVIAINPVENETITEFENNEDKLKYVMATRALHELVVIDHSLR